MSKKDGLKCVKCGFLAAPAKLSFQGIDIDGWQCKKCGEKYYEPSQAQRVLAFMKLRNSSVEAKLGRIKSNLILRIPKSIEMALGLKEGEKVHLNVKGRSSMELSA